jgi:hypothetical protein
MDITYPSLPLLFGSADTCFLLADTNLSGIDPSNTTYRLVRDAAASLGSSFQINGWPLVASANQNPALGQFWWDGWPHSFVAALMAQPSFNHQWEAFADGDEVLLKARKATSLATLDLVSGSPSFLTSYAMVLTGQADNAANENYYPRLLSQVRLIPNPVFSLGGPNQAGSPNPGIALPDLLSTTHVSNGQLMINLGAINASHQYVPLPSSPNIQHHPAGLLGVYLSPAISYGLPTETIIEHLAATTAYNALPAYYVLNTGKPQNQSGLDLLNSYSSNPSQPPLCHPLPYRILYPGLPIIEATWLIMPENLPITVMTMVLEAEVWTLNSIDSQIFTVQELNDEGGSPLPGGLYQACALPWLTGLDWGTVHELKLRLKLIDADRNEAEILVDHLRFRVRTINTNLTATIAFQNGFGGTETLTFWPGDPANQWQTEALPAFYLPILEAFVQSPTYHLWQDDRPMRSSPLDAPAELKWSPAKVQQCQIHINQEADTCQLSCQIS